MTKRTHISQREAHALKRRVRLLEEAEEKRRNRYVSDYPGGTHLGGVVVNEIDLMKVSIARRLGHAVVVTNLNGVLQLYALPVGRDHGR